jgi:hypothetical protein
MSASIISALRSLALCTSAGLSAANAKRAIQGSSQAGWADAM